MKRPEDLPPHSEGFILIFIICLLIIGILASGWTDSHIYKHVEIHNAR